jgi:hypothetical protein
MPMPTPKGSPLALRVDSGRTSGLPSGRSRQPTAWISCATTSGGDQAVQRVALVDVLVADAEALAGPPVRRCRQDVDEGEPRRGVVLVVPAHARDQRGEGCLVLVAERHAGAVRGELEVERPPLTGVAACRGEVATVAAVAVAREREPILDVVGAARVAGRTAAACAGIAHDIVLHCSSFILEVDLLATAVALLK